MSLIRVSFSFQLSVTYKPFMQSVNKINVVMLTVVMLSVTYKPFMLSVIKVNVVMLNSRAASL
jgi:hypothetical protein